MGPFYDIALSEEDASQKEEENIDTVELRLTSRVD